MGKWTKFYANGSRYVGTDEEIAAQKASWINSPSQNIVAVELEHNHCCLKINGAGEYWQSDTFQLSMSTGKQKVVKRRIQRQMMNGDGAFSTDRRGDDLTVTFHSSYKVFGGDTSIKERKEMMDFNGVWQPVRGEWRGKWLVLEYNVLENRINHYISDVKI